MTKGIIFDLDSCLRPADEPGQQLFAPAFDAITNANRGSHSASMLQNAFADMWRLPFDFVAEKYCFPVHLPRHITFRRFVNLDHLSA